MWLHVCKLPLLGVEVHCRQLRVVGGHMSSQWEGQLVGSGVLRVQDVHLARLLPSARVVLVENLLQSEEQLVFLLLQVGQLLLQLADLLLRLLVVVGVLLLLVLPLPLQSLIFLSFPFFILLPFPLLDDVVSEGIPGGPGHLWPLVDDRSSLLLVQIARRNRHVGFGVASGNHDGFKITSKTQICWAAESFTF